MLVQYRRRDQITSGTLREKCSSVRRRRTLALPQKMQRATGRASVLGSALEAKLATIDRLPAALLHKVFGEIEGRC